MRPLVKGRGHTLPNGLVRIESGVWRSLSKKQRYLIVFEEALHGIECWTSKSPIPISESVLRSPYMGPSSDLAFVPTSTAP